MKKYLLLAAFTLIQISSKSQGIKPTTEEELKFGTVGYRLHLQTGIGVPDGYTLKNYKTYQEGERKLDFRGLYRKGENSPCVILMVYTKPKANPYYFAIPTPDAPQSMWDLYNNSLNTTDENQQDKLKFFSYYLAQFSMYLASLNIITK